MKNTKCYLIGLFSILLVIGHSTSCSESQVSAAVNNYPSKELLQLIALKDEKAEKAKKNRDILTKMYRKAQKMIQAPVDSVFGKKPSRAKKAFYAVFGTAIFLIATYGVHEFLSVMAVLRDAKEAEDNTLVPNENNVIEQEQSDEVPLSPITKQTVDVETLNAAPDQMPTISQARQDDESKDAPEDQPQTVTNNHEKVISKEPKPGSVVGGGQVPRDNKPKNDGNAHQDATKKTEITKDIPKQDDSTKKEEESFLNWDQIRADWQWFYDKVDKFVNEPRQEQPDSEIQPKTVVPAVQNKPDKQQTPREAKDAVVPAKIEPKIPEAQPKVIVPPAQSRLGTEQQDQGEVKAPQIPVVVPVKNEPSENATKKEEQLLKKEQECEKVSNPEQSNENTSTTDETWNKELLVYTAGAIVAVAVWIFQSWNS